MTARHATTLLAAATASLVCALAALLTSAPNGQAGVAPRHGNAQRYDRDLAAAFVDAQCWQCHTVSTFAVELERDFGLKAPIAGAAGTDLAGIGGLYSYGWHVAHLFNPQAVRAGSAMPAQRQLFVLEGAATRPNVRGEPVAAFSFRGQRVIEFLQTLTAPGIGRAPWPKTLLRLPQPGGVAKGKELFERHCAGCHGTGGDGNGEVAPFFEKAPANLAAARMSWRSTRAQLPSYDDLYSTLTNGLPGSGMPAFAHLSEHDRASLVAYVVALNRELFDLYEPQFSASVITGPPRVDAALIARGMTAYGDEKNLCVRCHGPAGHGDGIERRELLRRYGVAPRNLRHERLRRASLEGVYATLALGVGEAMPGLLKDDGSNSDEIWALAAYVLDINAFER